MVKGKGKKDLSFSLSFGLMPGSFSFMNKLIYGVVALIVLSVVGSLFLVYIRPNEYGVLRVRFGPKKGIRKEAYTAGWYFIVPGLESMYRFPRNLQVVQWHKYYRKTRSRPGHRVLPPIKIQTSEGYNVTCDITIQYRIKDPYRVLTNIGPGYLYETSAIIPRAEKTLRLILGELTAEEFYRGPKRISHARKALLRLRSDLKEKGIDVVSLLVMEFSYDKRYQRMIEARKLQDQKVFLQKAKKRATVQLYKKQVIQEQGRALVKKVLAEGEREVAKLMAAAELYRRKRLAQGRLLRKLAEAWGLELKNKALQERGSQYLVALRMAEVMRGIKLIVLPSQGKYGFNPLDLSRAIQKFTFFLKGGMEKPSPATRPSGFDKKLPDFKPPELNIKLPRAVDLNRVDKLEDELNQPVKK